MSNADVSKLVGFNVENVLKPTTTKEVLSLLDIGISIMDEMLEDLDQINERFANERFSIAKNSFTQYLDKNDNAHIEFFSEEKKEEVLRNNRGPQEGDIIEIFTIDGSYCHWKNKNGKVIGRTKFKDSNCNSLIFISEEINGQIYSIDLKSKYHYDSERETIKWMVENNLLETFINFE